MKTLKTGMIAVAAVLIFGPAPAAAQNFYIGGYGGGNYTHDGNAGNDKMIYELGYGIGVMAGYAMASGLRLEGEIAYRSNGIDSIDGIPVGADMTSWAFMGNVLYEIQTQGGIKPHIGGGLGTARVTVEVGSLEFSDTVLAAQFIAGIDYELAPDLGLVVDFRHFRTQDLGLGGGMGLGGVEYANSSVSVGLRKKF